MLLCTTVKQFMRSQESGLPIRFAVFTWYEESRVSLCYAVQSLVYFWQSEILRSLENLNLILVLWTGPVDGIVADQLNSRSKNF